MARNVLGKMLTITGDDELIRKLKDIDRRHPKVTEASLLKVAQDIMNDSKENFVPRREGILEASGHVDPPERTSGRVTIKIGYGGSAAPYALAIHENPRAGKTRGESPSGKKYKTWAKVGEWKYLETPVMEATLDYRQNMVKTVNEFLRRQAIQ